MHDLVKDFALEESKGSCLMVEEGSRLVNEDDKTRILHLSINAKKPNDEAEHIINSSIESFKRLRSLVLLSSGIIGDRVSLLVHCKYLRVLVVIDKNVKMLPNSIGRLKHLRYWTFLVHV